MKKILIIISFILLNSSIVLADLKNNWGKYIQAYNEGHSRCRAEWAAIGDFKSNPKILLDIEHCALEKDAKALGEYGFGPDSNAMIGLIDKKHAEVFEAAKEASLDIIRYGNIETNLKRYLKRREGIINRYHNLQKALAFK